MIANAVAVGVLGVVFLFFAKETAGIHSKTESREET